MGGWVSCCFSSSWQQQSLALKVQNGECNRGVTVLHRGLLVSWHYSIFSAYLALNSFSKYRSRWLKTNIDVQIFFSGFDVIRLISMAAIECEAPIAMTYLANYHRSPDPSMVLRRGEWQPPHVFDVFLNQVSSDSIQVQALPPPRSV